MKCFNCSREFDEKDPAVACVIIDEETRTESQIKRISMPPNDQILALCPFCARAVTIGAITVSNAKHYSIKDFPYQYIE